MRSNDESEPGFVDALELVTQPQWGTVDLEADGSFEYAPRADYTGPDKFTYAYRNAATGN